MEEDLAKMCLMADIGYHLRSETDFVMVDLCKYVCDEMLHRTFVVREGDPIRLVDDVMSNNVRQLQDDVLRKKMDILVAIQM